MKLCLGTVQFGLKYGVASEGQPDESESIKIIDYAVNHGVTCLDTAAAYGTAEEIVGKYLKNRLSNREKIKIATKTPPAILDGIEEKKYYSAIKDGLVKSLQRLQTDYVDYYLFHTSHYIFDSLKTECLCRLKKEGLILNAGVSVYSVDESVHASKQGDIDCIQLPYNAIDRRLDKAGFFNSVNGKTIFCRSVLLQGLLTMDINNLPEHLKNSTRYLSKYNELCEKYNISKVSFAVNYVKQKNEVDFIIIGVDNIDQLDGQLNYMQNDISSEAIAEADKIFNEVDEKILDPRLWK